MHFDIPPAAINAFWGVMGTTVAGGLLVFFGIKSKSIPLQWGRKMNSLEPEYLTDSMLSNRLSEHCAKRRDELTGVFSEIKAAITELRQTNLEILQRVAKIEGKMETMYAADHK